MEQRLVLITLLIKLGVTAAIASALVRSLKFKSLLFAQERTLPEKIHLALFVGFPFALGVVVRLGVPNFLAADVSFEAAILMGVLGGRAAGALGGALMALPAAVHGEWLAFAVLPVTGAIAGLLRNLAPDRETIWSFSPFIDLSIYRWIRRNLKRPRLDWPTSFFLVIVLLGFARTELARAFPGRIFSLESSHWAIMIALYATSVASVAIPIKIWNSTRIELKLEEQARLLLQARMEALQSQINPHFLFNTLNSVSSLVRFDPDTARVLVVKLANILRRLLRKTDSFVQLREEVEFIDDYLDIEVVRFGRDKLSVTKDLDPDSLDVLVPSMLLQPLIENSIKHGIAPKIEGGSIHVRSRMVNSSLVIEVEDDGIGMGAAQFLERPTGLGGTGIGMANVAERLKVLYGDAAKMKVDTKEGKGTQVTISLPQVQGTDVGTSSVAVEAQRTT